MKKLYFFFTFLVFLFTTPCIHAQSIPSLISPGSSLSFFNVGGTYPTNGNYAITVASGDFNGDQINDLVVTNYFGNNMTVLLNNGDGTYGVGTTYPTKGTGPYGVISVDMNEDNITDIITVNTDGANVTIFTNNGNGTFNTGTTYPVNGNQPVSLISADFNGDNKVDLATANSDNTNISVLLNNGNGTFATGTTYSTIGSGPYSIVSADFNNDNKADLATSNYSSDSITVFFGNGDGTFSTGSTYPSNATYPISITSGDFNNDGKIDLATANNTNQNITVYSNNGSGIFNDKTTYDVGGSAPNFIVSSDFNNDGKIDLATANYTTKNITVFTNNGDGTYDIGITYPNLSSDGAAAVVADDLNGDGKIDLATSNGDSNNVTIFINSYTDSSNISQTPTFEIVNIDPTNDYLQYKIKLCTNSAMSIGCSTFSQPTSNLNWVGQNVGTSAYSSGSTATFILAIGNSLAPNTKYYWQSQSIDPAGTNNWSDSQSIPYTFTTKTRNEADFPLITNELATPSSTSAVITWTTNEISSSQVEYGLHQNYGLTTSITDVSSLVSSHSVSLTNLLPCARYYYRVISTDASSDQSVSAQKNFNTTGCVVSTITTGVETTLPITGGNVQLVNSLSTVQLNVPSDYASQQAVFQINKIDVTNTPNIPEGKSIPANNFYDLLAVTQDNQLLNNFNNPITFTIFYGSDTENNFNESTLDIYKYDGSNWLKKNCLLDTVANTLTCSLNGFSSYAVLGNPKNNSSNNSSSSSPSSSSSSVCTSLPPVSIPNLFQINTTKNSAKLFFTPLSDTSDFYISFSTNPNAEEHGESVTLIREGVQSHTVYYLKPNTIYYFKVRGQNGCMPGSWSNIMKIKTNNKIYYKNSIVKNFSSLINLPQKSTPIISKNILITPTISPPPKNNSTPTSTPISSPSIQTKKKCFLWWCW